MLKGKVILIGLFYACSLNAQDSLMTAQKKWSVSGYLKDMVTVTSPAPDSVLVDNLIHNRLNFSWTPHHRFSARMELRNRIFHGELVETVNEYGALFGIDYATLVDQNNDYFDLSWVPLNRQGLVIHTMIDRLYLDWRLEKWEIRVGRQRINWGTNIVWNPNDIFNAYNFFDFDYEERPGADALRVTRYLGFASSLEFAAKMADSFDQSVMAFLYKFNRGMYDIQIIGGVAAGDIVIGSGWAGNLGQAGFKGEMSYFHPYRDRPGSGPAFAAASTVDYSLPDGTYFLASYLYNSNGDLNLGQQENLFRFNQTLSAKNLMPFRHSVVAQVNLPVHPLVNTGLAVMAFPGDNALFISPNVGVSVIENLDLGLFAQILTNENTNGNYGLSSKSFFGRLKWSF